MHGVCIHQVQILGVDNIGRNESSAEQHCEEKEEALEILLKSQLREINENNLMKNMAKVEYPEWIQNEVMNLVEGTIVPVNFNKN